MTAQELTRLPSDWGSARLTSLVKDGPKNGYSGKAGESIDGTLTLRLSATTPGILVLSEETTKRLSKVIPPSSDLFLQPGDVLVQRSNTIDLVGMTVVFDGPPNVYVYPDLLIRLRFREDATAHWFWRYANSYRGRQYFVSVAAGSTGSMPKLSGQRLRNMPVPLPPLPEQRAIAAALSDVDELIGAMDKLIAKKRAIKLATMQQLLTGKTRLPGFSGEWRYRKLEDVVVFRSGHRNTDTAVPGGDFPFFVCSDEILRCNDFDFDCEAIIMSGNNASGVFHLHHYKGKFASRQRTYVMTPYAERLDCRYFLAQMRSHQKAFQEMAIGTTTLYVTIDMLRATEIPLPSLPEQRAIAQVLLDMDTEIAALEQRRDKTKAIKQGMMQSLLTGRVRLVSPDA